MVGGGPAATKGLSPAMIGAIAAGAVVVGVGAALIADSTATDDNVQYPTAHH
jgi:precorrin-6B methylase 1